jgi:hypothetical protein
MLAHGMEIEGLPQATEAIDVRVQDENNVDLLFQHQGIIHFEGITVNQTFCLEVLKRLIDAVRHKRGELWRDRLFHHDSMLAHSLL